MGHGRNEQDAWQDNGADVVMDSQGLSPVGSLDLTYWMIVTVMLKF
jgi:hypothetical protein